MSPASGPRLPGRMGGSGIGFGRGGGAGVRGASVRPRPAWASESERAVPVDVPFDRVLIDTPDLVSFIAALHVYPSGFCFTISSQLRPEASEEVEQVFAQGFAQDLRRVMPAEQAERSVRLGVRFADGRRAALNPNRHWSAHREPAVEAFPLVRLGHTSSDARVADLEIWIMGLPTEGDVELFYRWLDLDVPETSVAIEGDALRAASAGAVVLWDVSAEEEPPKPREG